MVRRATPLCSHSLGHCPEPTFLPPNACCLLCPKTLRSEGAGHQLTWDSGRGAVPSLGSSFQAQRRNLGPCRPPPRALRPLLLVFPPDWASFGGGGHPPLKVRTPSFTHPFIHSHMYAFTRWVVGSSWVGKNLSELLGTREIGRSFLSISQDPSDSRGRPRPWGAAGCAGHGGGRTSRSSPCCARLQGTGRGRR